MWSLAGKCDDSMTQQFLRSANAGCGASTYEPTDDFTGTVCKNTYYDENQLTVPRDIQKPAKSPKDPLFLRIRSCSIYELVDEKQYI